MKPQNNDTSTKPCSSQLRHSGTGLVTFTPGHPHSINIQNSLTPRTTTYTPSHWQHRHSITPLALFHNTHTHSHADTPTNSPTRRHTLRLHHNHPRSTHHRSSPAGRRVVTVSRSPTQTRQTQDTRNTKKSPRRSPRGQGVERAAQRQGEGHTPPRRP